LMDLSGRSRRRQLLKPGIDHRDLVLELSNRPAHAGLAPESEHSTFTLQLHVFELPAVSQRNENADDMLNSRWHVALCPAQGQGLIDPRLIHCTLHECGPLRYHAEIRVRLRPAVCDEIYVHYDRPHLTLPCLRDRGGNRPRPRLFDYESRDPWECFRGLGDAGLIIFRVSALSNDQRHKRSDDRLHPHSVAPRSSRTRRD
jgi:hypothetical protein